MALDIDQDIRYDTRMGKGIQMEKGIQTRMNKLASDNRMAPDKGIRLGTELYIVQGMGLGIALGIALGIVQGMGLGILTHNPCRMGRIHIQRTEIR